MTQRIIRLNLCKPIEVNSYEWYKDYQGEAWTKSKRNDFNLSYRTLGYFVLSFTLYFT